MYIYIYTYIHTYTCVYIYIYIYLRPLSRRHDVALHFVSQKLRLCSITVGFHNFNLRIFNLRVSNPSKLIVDVFWHDVGFQCARVSAQKNTMKFRKPAVCVLSGLHASICLWVPTRHFMQSSGVLIIIKSHISLLPIRRVSEADTLDRGPSGTLEWATVTYVHDIYIYIYIYIYTHIYFYIERERETMCMRRCYALYAHIYISLQPGICSRGQYPASDTLPAVGGPIRDSRAKYNIITRYNNT